VVVISESPEAATNRIVIEENTKDAVVIPCIQGYRKKFVKSGNSSHAKSILITNKATKKIHKE
jgi:hypothetical protein